MWFSQNKVKIDDPEILDLMNIMNIYLDRAPEIRKELDSTIIYSKDYDSIKESFLNKRYESLSKIYENDPTYLACATADIDQIKIDLVYDWEMTCFPKENSDFDNIHLLVTLFSRMLKKHSKTVMSWLNENSVSSQIHYCKTPEETFKYVSIKSISSAYRMLWVLCEIGDTSVSEGVAKWIMNHGGLCSGGAFDCITNSIRGIIPISSMKKILGIYTDIILDITHYHQVKGSGGTILTGGGSYDLSKPYQAVVNLSEINTPLSNNILHLVAKRKEILLKCLSYSHDSYITTTERNSIDYSSISELASTILIERGNPKYKSKYWKEIC